MGVPVGRVGDIGVGSCAAHKSTKAIVVTTVSGATTVLANGVPVTTAITVGVASCGHPSVAATFSATVLAEGAGVHRMGDIGVVPGGVYVLSGGSPNVLAG